MRRLKICLVLCICLIFYLTACSNSNYSREYERSEEEVPMVTPNEISSFDAALSIGRRILEREFPDKVSENTVYTVYEVTADHPGAQLNFVIEAIFEPNSNIEIDESYISNNADVRVVLRGSIYGLTFEYRPIEVE